MADVQAVTPAPNIEFYYVLSGLFGFAVITLVVGIFNYFKGQLKDLSATNMLIVERLEDLTLNQALQKKDLELVTKATEKNTDQIDRLNRLQHNETEEIAELIYAKIKAITP